MPTGWHLNAIAMPGLRWNSPFGYLVGHVYKTYNAYCEGKLGAQHLVLILLDSWSFETKLPFKIAWSAFGVVSFSRYEAFHWWRLFGIPVFW